MKITPDNGKSPDFGHGRAKTKGLSTEVANYLRQNYYCIPKWCGLYAHSHLDGMGGCWGISMGGGVSGCPLTLGEEYCRECEYHKDRIGENDD